MGEPDFAQAGAGERPTGLSQFLRSESARIIDEWSKAISVLRVTQHLSRPRLLNHMPALLLRIAETIDSQSGALPLDDAPEVHALDRLGEGFSLEDVATEYAALRRCVLRLYRERHPERQAKAARELERFHEAVDEAVRQSVVRFAEVRERTLRALDRLSEASLAAGDTTQLLVRVLTALRESTPSVDLAVVLLREGDWLVARAAVGVEDGDAREGFAIRVGDGFSGTVAATRQPQFTSSAATDARVRSEFLRKAGVRALYAVPLVDGEELLGVAHVGSLTAWDFPAEDRVLFHTAAARASSLLVKARLREAERRALSTLESMVASSPVGLAFYDRSLRFIRVNPAYAALTGRAPEEHLGRTLREVLTTSVAQHVEPLVRSVFETGEARIGVDVTGPRVSEPSRIGHWLCTYYPIRDHGGAVVQVGAIVMDVTARRGASETLALVDAMVASAPIAMGVLDPDLRYVRVNPLLAASNGLPIEAHLGRTVKEVLGDRAKEIVPILQRVLETGEPLRGLEIVVEPANDPGVQHTFVADYFPVDTNGRRVGLGGVVIDVTERNAREAELRRTAEFRERFLGIVSHDLRTPLSAIRTAAAVQLRVEGVPEQAQRAARRIASSADRMAEMVSELLDFTRARLGGGISVQRADSNLENLVRQVCDEAELASPGCEVRFRARGDFWGRWDEGRLGQVVQNLVKNALDYGVRGAPVEVSLEAEGRDSVRLAVTNRPEQPVPSEVLDSLFDPFRRGTQSANHAREGLGLGLFIAREIVAAHGGTLTASSDAQRGTTFLVRLPR